MTKLTDQDKEALRYDIRSDVWSLGITLAEAAYGKLPFRDSKGNTIKDRGVPEGNIIAIQQQILKADIDDLVDRSFSGPGDKSLDTHQKNMAIKQEILNTDVDALVEDTLGMKAGIYSNRIRDFVRKCLNKFEDRPKYHELVTSPFYEYYKNPEVVDQKAMKEFLEKYDDGEVDVSFLYDFT